MTWGSLVWSVKPDYPKDEQKVEGSEARISDVQVWIDTSNVPSWFLYNYIRSDTQNLAPHHQQEPLNPGLRLCLPSFVSQLLESPDTEPGAKSAVRLVRP